MPNSDKIAPPRITQSRSSGISATAQSVRPGNAESIESVLVHCRGRYVAIYDEQCEICQSFVSWLRILDRHRRVLPVPIVPELLSTIDPHLAVEECLRELHVLTPCGDTRRGWSGVAELARLFPSTFLIGWLGRIPPFRWIGEIAYKFVARNRYAVSKCRGGACRVARLDQLRKKAFFGTFWTCYLIGLLVRLPLILAAGGT